MVKAASLSALKAWQLKHAAFLMGMPSTGTKGALESIIRHRLDETHHKQPFVPRRVLSVDMGIRNLAYCVLDIPPNYSCVDKTPLKISAWQKRDLITPSQLTPSEAQEEGTRLQARARRRTLDSAIRRTVDTTFFTPSALSKTALQITTDLLALRPDAILIERQRFRSGGASAIQEWTLRVNMLESMLWACLHTFKSQSPKDAHPFPSIHEVNPARVAHFWTCAPETALIADKSLFEASTQSSVPAETCENARAKRRKVQKKDKIAIAKRWLTSGDGEVRLHLEGQAADVAKLFGTRARAREGRGVHVGKLDDLADCLLQGVAWVRWEENTFRLKGILGGEGEDL